MKPLSLHSYLSPWSLRQSVLCGPSLLSWDKGTKHQLWGWTGYLPSFVTSSQLQNPLVSFPHLPDDSVTVLMCVKQSTQLLAHPAGSGHKSSLLSCPHPTLHQKAPLGGPKTPRFHRLLGIDIYPTDLLHSLPVPQQCHGCCRGSEEAGQ